MINSLLTVIVLYRVNLDKCKTFMSLRDIFLSSNVKFDLVVYDNSPLEIKPTPQYDFCNIKYIHDPENSGISKAYNTAANIAQENGKQWLLFLDQDSSLPLNIFNEFKKFIALYPENTLFVPNLGQKDQILSPCKFRFYKGSSSRSMISGKLPTSNWSIFNSGILIKTESFKKIGGYNEKIKLDFSDHYFFSQYKKKFKNFIAIDALIDHSLSTHSKNENLIKNRFYQYCEGVKTYVLINRSVKCYFWLFVWTLLRAIKLSITFRSFTYIKVFYYRYLIYNPTHLS